MLEESLKAIGPRRYLEGIANWCAGQLYQGKRTHIEWTAKETVLPTVPATAGKPGSKASRVMLKVWGITGRIRSMNHQTPEGEFFRPDPVILDDAQMDENARSLSQCQARESILAAMEGVRGIPQFRGRLDRNWLAMS